MSANSPVRTCSTRPARDEVLPLARPPRIGIWGHYHGGNQGDDLVVATLIASIRSRLPDAEIIGFCVNPADTRERHAIPAFPLYRWAGRINQPTRVWTADEQIDRTDAAGWRARVKTCVKRRPWFLRSLRFARSVFRSVLGVVRQFAHAATSPITEIPFLVRSYRALRGVDLLVVAGSQALFDGWSGTWAHPYALFKWSMLARLAGTRFACLSIGGGPVNGRVARFFTRHSLRSMSYTSYRDETSARFVRLLGADDEPRVLPDMGFSVDAARFADLRPRPALAQGRIVVGLNPMAHNDPRYLPRGDAQSYLTYIRKTAEFAAWLLRKGYAVVLLYSQIRADPRACADVREFLRRSHALDSDAPLIEQPIHDYTELSSMLSWCDYVIAARYHCIVLPFVLGKPVIALGYHPKHRDLMESMGQGDYCLDIDRFTTRELIERFGILQRNREAIRAELERRLPDCRARLDAQFDDVFTSFGTAPAHPRNRERLNFGNAAV